MSRSLDEVKIPDTKLAREITVAAKMGEIMEEVGGDGYLMTGSVTRKYIAEIADGLAPELRKRHLIRDSYEHDHLRDNLLAF